MSRVEDAFKNGKAFIPFITCGFPDLETTKECVLKMAENGADIIELGIPFSDPTAEGVVIQEANEKALAGFVTTDKVFELVSELRKETQVPLVFMTYANVVFSYGTERFLERSKAVGIDGIILPDVPFEEKEEFEPVCDKYDIPLISFVAPTSHSRIVDIVKEAKGFIYVVSSLGVTGTRSEINTDLSSIVSLIKANTTVPCAIGFGISGPDQAAKMASISDGAIVGSAIIKLIGQGKDGAPERVGAFVKEMKNAVKSSEST